MLKTIGKLTVAAFIFNTIGKAAILAAAEALSEESEEVAHELDRYNTSSQEVMSDRAWKRLHFTELSLAVIRATSEK